MRNPVHSQMIKTSGYRMRELTGRVEFWERFIGLRGCSGFTRFIGSLSTCLRFTVWIHSPNIYIYINSYADGYANSHARGDKRREKQRDFATLWVPSLLWSQPRRLGLKTSSHSYRALAALQGRGRCPRPAADEIEHHSQNDSIDV